MFKRMIVWMPVLLMGFLLHSVCEAQTAQPTPEKRKPIVCKWNTLGGMRYYYAGLKIADGQSLKNIISPLNDPEANRLLNVSSGSHTAGVAFLIGGIPCLVGGLLTVGRNYDNTTRSLNSTGTAGLIVAAVGLVGDYIGAFKLQESENIRVRWAV